MRQINYYDNYVKSLGEENCSVLLSILPEKWVKNYEKLIQLMSSYNELVWEYTKLIQKNDTIVDKIGFDYERANALLESVKKTANGLTLDSISDIPLLLQDLETLKVELENKKFDDLHNNRRINSEISISTVMGDLSNIVSEIKNQLEIMHEIDNDEFKRLDNIAIRDDHKNKIKQNLVSRFSKNGNISGDVIDVICDQFCELLLGNLDLVKTVYSQVMPTANEIVTSYDSRSESFVRPKLDLFLFDYSQQLSGMLSYVDSASYCDNLELRNEMLTKISQSVGGVTYFNSQLKNAVMGDTNVDFDRIREMHSALGDVNDVYRNMSFNSNVVNLINSFDRHNNVDNVVDYENDTRSI